MMSRACRRCPLHHVLASFAVASPNAPIVMLHARSVPCENRHIVFDTVFTSTDGANNTLGGTDNNVVIIVRLFTVGPLPAYALRLAL
jgi:hypothetical protein